MPSKESEALSAIREKIGVIFPDRSTHTPHFSPPAAGKAKVRIDGHYERTDGTPPVPVELDQEYCMVILPKKVAKHYKMVVHNDDWGLCIWDPVKGTVACLD